MIRTSYFLDVIAVFTAAAAVDPGCWSRPRAHADFQKKFLEVALCENEYFSYKSSACIKNWGYISAVACRHVDQVLEKVIRSGMKGPKVRNERQLHADTQLMFNAVCSLCRAPRHLLCVFVCPWCVQDLMSL